MAKPPFAVEYHHDPKSKFQFAQDAADDVWLAKVAAEGWIVFSHDRKFHTLLPERSAVKQHKAGCFYLPGASSPTWDKLRYFIRAYAGIFSRINDTTKPFIYNLSHGGRFTRIQIR
jgi:hypothetical protein